MDRDDPSTSLQSILMGMNTRLLGFRAYRAYRAMCWIQRDASRKAYIKYDINVYKYNITYLPITLVLV